MQKNELRNSGVMLRNEEIEEVEKERNDKEIYDSSKYISKAKRVQNGTVPMNILQFHHSFSYDCQKYFNLCVAEPNVIIFSSGNMLHFLNTATNQIWFRRGSTGGGIGHVTKNPVFNHIAVGENGIKPPIIIYKWPSMDIVTVLHDGTLKRYSHLVYSTDGLLLISQGGDPDYTITFWDWQKSKIALKYKSYNRDVYNVTISPLLPEYLVTSGSGHIKFWKISETFTGLKLKGEIGRFGQTEISDIVGVYIMPDGKVASGCEWGNILLWEEGLITLEICRKNRQPCHARAITQFEYINGELISIGMDGWIRVWSYKTIDEANSHSKNCFLEMQPIYEYHVGEVDEGSILMCIRKQEPDIPESTFWYAQDGNGGIWLIDLHTLKAEPPRKIFTCPAGAIVDIDNATWGPFVATLSKAGQLHIYNYTEKRLILTHNFDDIGSQIVWFPSRIEATGSTLACAFESGVIRVIAAAVSIANTVNNIKGDYIRLIQVVKPHRLAITVMSLNPSYSLLVTGGENSTVFSFAIVVTDSYPVIMPIGFIKVPSEVTCLTWKPQRETTLLIGCSQGDCVEVTLPSVPQSYTTGSYELVQCQPKTFKFHSTKSAIQRELIRLKREKEKEEEIRLKREEMERLMAEDPLMEIDEEAFLAVEEEPLPEVYIPKIPNKVLMTRYIDHNVIWLSMSGFDAGYMYEYLSPEVTVTVEKEPVKSIAIYDADDAEIRSSLFYKGRKYMFLGMQHGEIRVCKWKSENYTDLSNYWILSMHDNYNGCIPKMILSHDQKMLFTCGYDGNLFSYEIIDDTPPETIEFEITKGVVSLPLINVEDIKEVDHASLEEMIQQVEHDRIATAAEQSKRQILEILSKLRKEYSEIVKRSNALPKPHQMTHEEFELDSRITADLNKKLVAEMAAVRGKLAFEVDKNELRLQKLLEHFIKPIECLPFVVCKISKPDSIVYSLRQHVLNTDVNLPSIDATKHLHSLDELMNENSILEDQMQFDEEKQSEQEEIPEVEMDVPKAKEQPDFLKDISIKDADSSLRIQLNQILRKYTLRKTKLEEREKEWKAIYNKKPDISINYAHDIRTIEEAKRTIGDYKLKTSLTVNISDERDTILSKYKELLKCRKKLYYSQEAFNVRLKAVRTEKEHLHAEVLHLLKSLKQIHAEIPLKNIKSLPAIPSLNIDMEFPERKVMIEKYTLKAETIEDAERQNSLSLLEQIPIYFDEEYEVLLLDEKFLEHAKIPNGSALLSVSKKKIKIQTNVQDDMTLLYLSDDIDSPWEREMKSSRILRKVYEQDCILRYVETNCNNLDQKLDTLENDRLNIIAENVSLNLFLLTLRQEYAILKEYETMENALSDQVDCNLKEVAAVRQKIHTITDKLDVKTKEITKLHNQIKDIASEYMNMINNNKFRNFLCKIFKKKYKELEEVNETTTTTTETESDETETVDSKELELMYFDENVCPPGCDKALYDLAFLMREKRYACERQIKDAQQIVELYHKEIQSQTKKLKVIEHTLMKNEENLKLFMLKKQKKLNDVDVMVLMNLHQLQHFKEANILSKVYNCVVFDKKKLSRLYARIQELQEETLELQEKHNSARAHFQRLQLDCRHMRANNKNLKNEIKLQIMNKFGQNIPINKLYEMMLRRLTYDIKASLNEATAYFAKQIKHIKESYSEELITFNKLVQENTQKLSFVTILVEEQAKLQKLLKQHIMSNEEMLQLEKKYKSDIKKIEKILENQTRQKFLFQNDIKNLRLKTKPNQFNKVTLRNDKDVEFQSGENSNCDRLKQK